MKLRFLSAALLVAAPASGAQGRWSVDFEALRLELSGHDRPVLTDRAVTGSSSTAATYRLETGDAVAYRGEVRWKPGRWSFGLDFLSHRTDQDLDRRTGAAGAGVDERIFVVGGGQVVSRGPDERLYFERLEDTTVELWALDLFAARALVSRPRAELAWLVGVRAADFDNDYRAIAGLEETGGLRLDAASNYDRMHGPLLGLAGRLERGRHQFTVHLVQAVVWGDVELSSGVRQFVGPPSREVDDVPGVVDQTRFTTDESVSIPMTELRFKWRFRLTDRIAAGFGAFASRWWDVAVPPGVEPGAALDTQDESTLDTFGLAAGLAVGF